MRNISGEAVAMSQFCWPGLQHQKKDHREFSSVESDDDSCFSGDVPDVTRRTEASSCLVVLGFVQASCNSDVCPAFFPPTDVESEMASANSQSFLRFGSQ